MIIQEAILQLNPSIVKLIDRVGYDANDNVVEYDMDAAQALMDSKAYVEQRVLEYPSIQEQLDMQYWDSVNGTTTWKDAIAAVKTENPKP
jgi:hypothetical protein